MTFGDHSLFVDQDKVHLLLLVVAHSTLAVLVCYLPSLEVLADPQVVSDEFQNRCS